MIDGDRWGASMDYNFAEWLGLKRTTFLEKMKGLELEEGGEEGADV